jgi:hypothetical protein
LVGLVIVRAMIIIVPLIAAFTLGAILFLVTILNLVACVSVANDVPQVLFILTLVELTQR